MTTLGKLVSQMFCDSHALPSQPRTPLLPDPQQMSFGDFSLKVVIISI